MKLYSLYSHQTFNDFNDSTRQVMPHLHIPLQVLLQLGLKLAEERHSALD